MRKCSAKFQPSLPNLSFSNEFRVLVLHDAHYASEHAILGEEDVFSGTQNASFDITMEATRFVGHRSPVFSTKMRLIQIGSKRRVGFRMLEAGDPEVLGLGRSAVRDQRRSAPR